MELETVLATGSTKLAGASRDQPPLAHGVKIARFDIAFANESLPDFQGLISRRAEWSKVSSRWPVNEADSNADDDPLNEV